MKNLNLKLNAKNSFYAMCVVMALSTALAIGAVVLSTQFLGSQSKKLVNLKLQYRIPEENQAALKRAKTDIAKYTELTNIAKSVVPQEKDQAKTVREIINIANSTLDATGKKGIQILSITFPSSNLGTVAPVASTGTTGGATGGTPTPVAPPVSQVQPVQGIPGLYVLPITVQSDPASPISFDQLISFLNKLEQNRRTAQVAQISITPQTGTGGGKGLSFTITVNVYIKP